MRRENRLAVAVNRLDNQHQSNRIRAVALVYVILGLSHQQSGVIKAAVSQRLFRKRLTLSNASFPVLHRLSCHNRTDVYV